MASVGQLFEVAVPAVVEAADAELFTSAKGTASELEVVAKLLRRGHKVAVPVVDDDGVDLIVDYRTLVQVKFTSLRTPKHGLPLFCPGRRVRSRPGDPWRWVSLADHVDVVVIDVQGIGWYVVPRAVIGRRQNVSFGPSMDEWREAWSVFDAS